MQNMPCWKWGAVSYTNSFNKPSRPWEHPFSVVVTHDPPGLPASIGKMDPRSAVVFTAGEAAVEAL